MYDIKAEATDTAGNTESSPIVTNITYDITSPNDPTVTSTSHTENIWSNDSTIDVSWDGATDTSGIAGYSYEWNTLASTVPDQISEGLDTATESPALADGDSHYFHLSTLDNAGNWTSTVHLGPLFVDTTGPGIPSATPVAGDYTSDQSVTLLSSDEASGLSSIYYTTGGTTPDATKTLYAGAITVDKDMTIKAIAYDNVGNASEILEAVYGIAPVISAETSSAVSSTGTTIAWTTDDPATSRVIYDTVPHAELGAAPNYGYAFSTVEDPTKVTVHSVDITGLIAGTTYYFRTVSHGSPEAVSTEKTFTTSAADAGGGGTAGGGGGGTGDGLSDGLSEKAPVCNNAKPGSAPTLLSAVAGTNSVTLTWSEALNPVTYYLVTYGTAPGLQQYGNPNAGPAGTTQFTVSGLAGGATYYFRVRAGNGCKPGDFSNELSAGPGGGFIAGPAAGFAPGVLGATTEEVTPTPDISPEAIPTPGQVLGTETSTESSIWPWWLYLGGFGSATIVGILKVIGLL